MIKESNENVADNPAQVELSSSELLQNDGSSESAIDGVVRIAIEPSKASIPESKNENGGSVVRSVSSPSLLPTLSSERYREKESSSYSNRQLERVLETDRNQPLASKKDTKRMKRITNHHDTKFIDEESKASNPPKELVTVEAEKVHQFLEHKIMNDLGKSMQMSKMENASKTPDKPRSRTIPGVLSSTKPDPTEKRDLLSRFKTYNDQILQSTNTGNRKYEQLNQHSPKKDQHLQSKVLKNAKIKSKNSVLSQKECIIQNNEHLSQVKTPESQRQISLSSDEEIRLVRGIGLSPLMLDIFRIFTILFSAASIASGACTAFDGKTSFINSITDTPLMWIVRIYIAWFHLVLIVVELDIEVRGIIPKSTFGNFLHKGYLISLIGLLQSFPSGMMSLENVVSEILSGSLSVRSIQIRVAFAVLGVCSKGLIACGIVYIFLGICGWNGESRRRAFKARHLSR